MSDTAIAERTVRTTPEGPPPARPFGLLRHSAALARRSLVKVRRSPAQLIDATLTPIIFGVIFIYLLGGAIAGSTGNYLQTLLPALMVLAAMIAAMASGVNLNTDIKKGIFDRFRSLPIGRSAPLIGLVLGDVVRYLVAVTIMFAFGTVLGFRIATDPLSALAGALLTVLFAFCVSWIFVLLGVLMNEPGAVGGIAMLTTVPLTFGTNMLAPTQTLPGWLQAWVKVNPVTHAMDAARGLLVGGPVSGPVTRTLLWSAGLLLVCVPLAVRAYRRRA